MIIPTPILVVFHPFETPFGSRQKVSQMSGKTTKVGVGMIIFREKKFCYKISKCEERWKIFIKMEFFYLDEKAKTGIPVFFSP